MLNVNYREDKTGFNSNVAASARWSEPQWSFGKRPRTSHSVAVGKRSLSTSFKDLQRLERKKTFIHKFKSALVYRYHTCAMSRLDTSGFSRHRLGQPSETRTCVRVSLGQDIFICSKFFFYVSTSLSFIIIDSDCY